MKIIHVPFTYYPDSVGGTEVYVGSLARNLQGMGVECLIVAPGSVEGADRYQHQGTRVCRFSLSDESSSLLSELYGEGDPQAATRFGEILDEEHPDIVHMHAFTRGVSLLLAREAKRRGVKVVFTYHTPTVSCQRGTLLRNGREICEGVLDRRICTRCTLQGLGVNGMGGRILSAIPTPIGRTIGAVGLEGGRWTALRMSQLIQLRHDSFRQLMDESNAVVALCQWTKELLIKNGVPAAKISLSRHGLPHELTEPVRPLIPLDQRPLRIAFLGRADRTKGVDTLIRAVRSLPDLDVSLDLYGIVQGGAHEDYFEELRVFAEDDKRISFLAGVPNDQVTNVLRGYHLLAVPSRWLETGPLVVLEAFAAGVPVLGSDLGGIAELVVNGSNGMLVSPESVDAWAGCIRRITEGDKLVEALRRGVKPPRKMAEPAREMLAIYQRILGQVAQQAKTSIG